MHGVLSAIRPNFNLDDLLAHEFSGRLLASMHGYHMMNTHLYSGGSGSVMAVVVSVEFVKLSIVMVE